MKSNYEIIEKSKKDAEIKFKDATNFDYVDRKSLLQTIGNCESIYFNLGNLVYINSPMLSFIFEAIVLFQNSNKKITFEFKKTSLSNMLCNSLAKAFASENINLFLTE